MVAVQVVSVNFVLPSQGLLFCPHNVLLVVIVLGSCLSLAALTDNNINTTEVHHHNECHGGNSFGFVTQNLRQPQGGGCDVERLKCKTFKSRGKVAFVDSQA